MAHIPWAICFLRVTWIFWRNTVFRLYVAVISKIIFACIC